MGDIGHLESPLAQEAPIVWINQHFELRELGDVEEELWLRAPVALTVHHPWVAGMVHACRTDATQKGLRLCYIISLSPAVGYFGEPMNAHRLIRYKAKRDESTAQSWTRDNGPGKESRK
jgi:hypothetical protein